MAAGLVLATLALAACGGGTTGPGVAASSAPTAGARPPSAPPPAVTSAPATSPTTPAAPATAATPGTRTQPPPAAAPPDAAPPPAAPAAQAPAASAPRQRQPKPVARQPAAARIDELAVLTLTHRASPAHYFQQGTIAGTYDGTMELEARITSKGVLVHFTAAVEGGTIEGRGVVVAVIRGLRTPGLRGTAAIVGGSGRYAGIHGRGLRVSGRAKPDASHARVRLQGVVERGP
jgi:hypothetical protein